MRQLRFTNLIHFSAVLALVSQLFLSCEKNDSTVLDSFGISPSLISSSITPSTINTDTINVGAERKPEDILPLRLNAFAKALSPSGQPTIVKAALFRENSTTPIVTSELHDDGSAADSIKGDGIYSGSLSFSIQRSEVGTFRIELSARSSGGYQSNTMIRPLSIIRNNHPPTLSNLQAPDTLKLSALPSSLLLTVRAADQDGLSDIRQVIFNSFLPDGRGASQNPFQMYDNGTNGDVTSGDGVYSLRIATPTSPGQYRFEFQAADRSNAVSTMLIHTITVVP